MTSPRLSILPAAAAPLALVLVSCLAVPAGLLLVYSFWQASFFTITPDVTLANYVRIIEQPVYFELIARSLAIGLIVAVVTVPLSFAVAYAATMDLRRWGAAILVLVTLSMLSSYLVRIYAWKTILGPNGVINQLLIGLGVVSEPLGFLLYGDVALVVTLTHILVPYAVLPIYSALQNVDRQVIEASRDLGATPRLSFWQVILPLAMPGVQAAFLFTFILAAADYVTPQLVGGSSGMLVGRAIADQYGMAGNPPFGAALSIGLMIGFAVVIGLLEGLRRFLHALPRRRILPRNALLSHLRWRFPWAAATVLAILVFLYAPLVIVLVLSFNSSPAGIFPLQGLTLRWYAELFASSQFLRALQSSVAIGVIAAVASLLVGASAAFALTRQRFVLRRALNVLVLGPIVIPGIVIGVAILSSLSMIGWPAGLGPTALVHVLFALPFVVLVLRARLRDFDRHVEEAARDLGSGPWRALRTVTLPMMMPSLVATGVLVFALSMDEFVITNFVIGANATLPVYIWAQMRTGITPSVNAVSTIVLVVTLALIGFAWFILWRQRRTARYISTAVAADRARSIGSEGP